MRIAAIVYIIIAVIANFMIDHLTVFVLASFSFPLLLWLLLRKNKSKKIQRHEPAEKAEAVS